MITLLPRESRDRFDLDDNVCLGLDTTSKESVQTGEEVVEKVVGGNWTCSLIPCILLYHGMQPIQISR